MSKFSIVPIPEIKDAFIITADRYHDERGFFQEHYNDQKYQSAVQHCKQVSFSQSSQNVIRGLHCSRYGKLVQCLRGKLLDVMVDLRPESPTYLNWKGVLLEENEAKQVFIPGGCGHGFFSYADNTLMLYAQEGTFNPPTEMNVNYADPELKVEWPAPVNGGVHIISAKDKEAPMYREVQRMFDERNKKQ